MCCRGAQGWAVDMTEDGCLGWMEVVPLREAGICLAALKAQCCSYNSSYRQLPPQAPQQTVPTCSLHSSPKVLDKVDKVFLLLQLRMLYVWDGLLLLLRGTCSIPCA